MRNFHPSYRPDIDGLRAIAIACVVMFHAFPSLCRGGFIGVDVFFVISGFLISTIIFRSLERGEFDFIEFYLRRINRIFPALMLVLAALLLFGWIAFLPDDYRLLGKHIAAGAGFFQNFVLWKEAGYFDRASQCKPLMHLWSLAVEEQFYLLYPPLLWMAWKWNWRPAIPVAIIGTLSFALNVYSVRHHPEAAFFLPQNRLWELMAGGGLSYALLHQAEALSSQHERMMLRHALSGMGILAILLSAAFLPASAPFPGWWALLPVAGACLLIFAGPAAWSNNIILSNRPMLFLGRISYPLYLWHWPLLSAIHIMDIGSTSAVRAAALGAALLLASLTYYCVELPLKSGRRKTVQAQWLAAACAVVGCLGLSIYAADGMASRFPQAIRQLASYHPDLTTADAGYPDCWLMPDAPPNAYTSRCFGDIKTHGSHAVAVWGDSHAARLYPAIAHLLAGKVTVAQFTRSTCPPILNHTGDNSGTACMAGNDYVVSLLTKYRPDIVILYARWGRPQNDWQSDAQLRQGLLESIQRLRTAGIDQIYVLGPAPEWTNALPKLLYNYWKADFPLHRIPLRMDYGLNAHIFAVDRYLKGMIPADAHVHYISVLDIMCNASGCLTRTDSNNPLSVTTPDYGHFTSEGALFLAKRLPFLSGMH